MAARGARAADAADPAHRRAHVYDSGRCGRTGPHRRVPEGAAAMGLGCPRQRADRHALGCGRCRPHSQIRGGAGCARARRHPGQWRCGRGAVATADPHSADRVHVDPRSGRRGLRRKSGATGRQRHRFHFDRIRHEWEMAGTAERDRAPRDASGGAARSHPTRGNFAVRRTPVRGAVARDRVELDRRGETRPRSRAPSWNSRAPRTAV